VLGGPDIYIVQQLIPTVYMCQILRKLIDIRQSYRKNKKAYFFAPSCRQCAYYQAPKYRYL